MKMKKIAFVLAATLSLTTFAACGNVNKKTKFYDYWQKDALTNEKVDETLKYSVTFEKGSGLSALNYTLSYDEGTYVTHLQSTNDGYTYATELTMPVTYTFGEGENSSVSFTDKVITEVKFKRADKALAPLSSKKTVVSHSPINGTSTKLENCYSAYDFTVETTYQENGLGKSTVSYRKTEDFEADVKTTPDFEYTTGDYTYLDNELLLLALRAVYSNTSSGSFEVYNPYLETMQKINYSFAAQSGEDFSHKVNGTALDNVKISYREASLVIDDKNPGATQIARIATANNESKNTHRNVMLFLKTPIAYGFGSFQYKLIEANYL